MSSNGLKYWIIRDVAFGFFSLPAILYVLFYIFISRSNPLSNSLYWVLSIISFIFGVCLLIWARKFYLLYVEESKNNTQTPMQKALTIGLICLFGILIVYRFIITTNFKTISAPTLAYIGLIVLTLIIVNFLVKSPKKLKKK